MNIMNKIAERRYEERQAARADREQHRSTSLDSDDDLPFDNNDETQF